MPQQKKRQMNSRGMSIRENKWQNLFGGPGEGCGHGVLDLVQVLDALGDVYHDVGPGALGPEAPDPARLTHVPAVRVGQVAPAVLHVLHGRHLARLDVHDELVVHRARGHEEPVVLVGRLAQAHLRRLNRHRLAVRHHRLRLDDRDARVLRLEVLQGDLQVQLA